MAIRVTQAATGARRARFLRARLSQELTTARRAHGLSSREVALQARCSRGWIERTERGEGSMPLDLLARHAATLGLELSVSLHPAGPPVRDKGQLALLDRFRPRLSPSLRLRSEVAMPIAGDRRSADGAIDGEGWDAVVEAETRVDDAQALVREIEAKRRDLGVRRAILLLADTRHNRAVLASVPELRQRFPVSTRQALAALKQGRDPGGDCLILL